MIFNLRHSEIYKAVLFYRLFPAGILKFYKILFFTLGLIPAGVLIINKASLTSVNISIGWSLIVLPFAFSSLFFELFAEHYLKNPKAGGTNGFDKLTTGNLADL